MGVGGGYRTCPCKERLCFPAEPRPEPAWARHLAPRESSGRIDGLQRAQVPARTANQPCPPHPRGGWLHPLLTPMPTLPRLLKPSHCDFGAHSQSWPECPISSDYCLETPHALALWGLGPPLQSLLPPTPSEHTPGGRGGGLLAFHSGFLKIPVSLAA